MPIRVDGAHFPHSILVAYPVEEVVDPTWRWILKCMDWGDAPNLVHLRRVVSEQEGL